MGLGAAGVLTACAPAPLSTASGAAAGTTTPAPTASPSAPTTAPTTTGAVPGDAVTTLPMATGPSGTTASRSVTAPAAAATLPTTRSTTRATVAPPAPVTGVVVDADGHLETAFATRDGGIVCAVVDGPQVRCDVESATFRPPPAPADCHGDWGGSIQLSARGASLGCATDTVLADAAPGGPGTWWQTLPAARTLARPDGRSEVTLATDATVQAGSGASALSCRSDGTSVTCALGRAGFTLSRSAYALR